MIEQVRHLGVEKATWRGGLRGALLTTTLLVSVAPALPVQAQSTAWEGGTSTDWFDADNWDAIIPPTATDDAIIAYLGAPYMPVIEGTVAIADGVFLGVAGGASTGTLTIRNGGGLANEESAIGFDTGTNYAVSVTGVGSTWNSNFLTVGGAGAGTLGISDGGVVSGIFGIVGDSASSTGTVRVTGPGSSWSSANLNVGYEGAGMLVISDGGEVVNIASTVGAAAGSHGTARVTGPDSHWTNATSLVVGDSGEGGLTIVDGGAVSSGGGIVGDAAGSEGMVAVSGTGSTWAIVHDLVVGGAGTGTLSIVDGGAVDSTYGYIGDAAGSDGNVTVSGAGSTWTNAAHLVAGAGNLGEGRLNIVDGGTVSSNVGTIGLVAGSSGMAAVTGAGSSWTNTNVLTVGGAGAGTLDIAAGGTVSSDVGTIGGQAGSVGMATVTGAGSNWTTASDFYVGYSGIGTIGIADGGSISAASVTIAGAAGSTGTLNIGAAAGDAATGAGTLDTPNVTFGPGVGTLNFNHSETSYDFGTAISGFGAISHTAGVTNLTADSSAFSGTTSVNGGSLYVDGVLGGTVGVYDGGTLGGIGTIGDVLSINAGGTVAPGNSIGTLNVGNLVFNADSVYEVEVNGAGQSDFISAANTAIINGGTVNVVPYPDFVLDADYTIVTALGGVGVNIPMTANIDSLFITPILTYDAFHILLTLTQTADFVDVAMTPNQIAAAGGARSLGGGPVYLAIAALGDVGEVRAAFDAISGEIGASAQTALLDDSRFPREAALDRLRVALGGVGADSGTQIEDRISGNLALWGQGFGALSRWSSDGNAAAMDRTIGGFLMGGDALIAENLRLGVMGGYSLSRFSVDDRASAGMADTYTLGAYGGGEWDAFTLKGGLAHSWHSLDTSRSMAFSGFSDDLSASYGARTLQTWGEAAYSFEAGAVRLEPFANLAYVNLSTDSFTETGGLAALNATSSVADAAFTTIGLRAETDATLGDFDAKLRGMVGWRHAFGDTPTSQMRFASGSDAFTIAGVPLSRDALVLDAGIDVSLTDNATLGFAYGGQFGSGGRDHSATLNFNVQF